LYKKVGPYLVLIYAFGRRDKWGHFYAERPLVCQRASTRSAPTSVCKTLDTTIIDGFLLRYANINGSAKAYPHSYYMNNATLNTTLSGTLDTVINTTFPSTQWHSVPSRFALYRRKRLLHVSHFKIYLAYAAIRLAPLSRCERVLVAR